MPSILIADAFKSSLVMTSEVFKDKLPGANILIVKDAESCIKAARESKPDLVVVDFDLPDADGISLTKALRKEFVGPVIITAFPNEEIENAIETELFAYNDSLSWVRKPIKSKDLGRVIDDFLLEKKRVTRRFLTELKAEVIGHGSGKGKRAPKAEGRIINIGIGGALVKLEESVKVKVGEEMVLKFSFQDHFKKQKKRAEKMASELLIGSSKLKAKVVWTDKAKKQAGFTFGDLTESNLKSLEFFLKSATEEV